MKLATLSISNEFRPAILLGDDVVDLVAARRVCAAARLLPGDMLGILAGEAPALRLAREVAEDAQARRDVFRNASALLQAGSVRFAAPLPNPRLILAIGANYHDHLKEMNTPPPPTPMAFYKNLSSIVGPGADILLPPSNPDLVDYEGEFTIVIGRTCSNVS